MGRASINISLVDSPMSEDWKGPYTEDKRSRAERRWKRREVLVLQNCSGSTSKTMKSHGNMAVSTDKNVHIVEHQTDEDYEIFLDAYVSDIDCASANNVGSDIDINTGYNSDNDDDADLDYKMFLENMREEGDSYVYSLHNANDLTHNRAGSVGNTRSNSMREHTGRPMQSQPSLGPERGPSNKRPSKVPQNISHNDVEFDDVDEDYQLFLNSCRIDGDSLVHINDELIRKRSSARQNSQVSNHAFYTPQVHSEIDEDYQLFLNSDEIVDGDLVYMPDRNTRKASEVEGGNTRKASEVEGGSNSSDSDLIIIEPNLFCEDTPFVSSKVYDSSWFENEMSPGDSKQFSADHSQFRRRLMECLQNPFDQQEYDAAVHLVHKRTKTECHRETRQGVIKSYHISGVNKSYLELHPDLAEAIAAIKEPHRVLFLLRGFSFWLRNLSHAGVFKPWLDKSCLEILGRM